MVVTGPTVIVPLLRSVRPVSSVARLLRWEGIVIDPLGAVLAILVFDLILATLNPEHATSPLLTLGDEACSVAEPFYIPFVSSSCIAFALASDSH